jgi:protein-disulfide isomerase
MQNKLGLILGATALFLFGLMAGLLIGHSVLGCKPEQITLADGKTLEVRLNELEQKILDTKKTIDHVDGILTRLTKPSTPQRSNRPDPEKNYEFDLSTAPWKGATDPKVILIEFADFQCPFCKRFDGVVHEILDKYPNDVRFYFKTRLIHSSALPAHEAAIEAKEQGKFWEMYDTLYAKFGKVKPEDLEKYAVEIGLDLERYKKAMSEHLHEDEVKKDDAEAREHSINATPTIFINGYYQPNISPDNIKQKIEEAIK